MEVTGSFEILIPIYKTTRCYSSTLKMKKWLPQKRWYLSTNYRMPLRPVDTLPVLFVYTFLHVSASTVATRGLSDSSPKKTSCKDYCVTVLLLLLSFLSPLCRVFTSTYFKKKHVSRAYSDAALLHLQFVLNVVISPL